MELAVAQWNSPSQDVQQSPAKILMLHGMGGTGALWRPLAIALENEFDVLAPDQRGHGKSRVTSKAGAREEALYTPLAFGQDLVETLEARRFYPTWVLGHSMGVRSACALAHLRPDWVQGLIIIDLGFSGMAGGGLGQDLADFIRILPNRFDSRAEARAFMVQCPDPAIAQYLMAVTVAEAAGSQAITFPFDHAALIATIESARDSSVRGWVTEFLQTGKPLLVLRGARSLVWSHEEFEQERKSFAWAPNARFLEVEGAGHGLPFEKRLELAAMIRELAKR